MRLTWWFSDKESAYQCKRLGLDPWVGKIPWRRKWQPTPLSLPGKSHGQMSLVGYSPWGCKRVGHNLANKYTRTHQWLRLHASAAEVAQTVKCLPAMRETGIQSLGREDPLEKEMATHSSTIAWKIP